MAKLSENHTNGEWLQFISDMEYVAVLLEHMEMPECAETVRSAAKLLIEWNPERRRRIERWDK